MQGESLGRARNGLRCSGSYGVTYAPRRFFFRRMRAHEDSPWWMTVNRPAPLAVRARALRRHTCAAGGKTKRPPVASANPDLGGRTGPRHGGETTERARPKRGGLPRCTPLHCVPLVVRG